jgi:aryl-alcohol dehydrogenase-like predicted oxidoreductase
VTAAIVGVRTAAHVDGVIGAATFRLSEEEVSEIGRFMAASAVPA